MEQKTKPRRPMDPMDRDRQAQAFSDGAGGEEIRILCDEAHEVIEALAQELRGIV